MRPTSMPVPVRASLNNIRPTNDGTTSNANPIVASPTAERMSTFFMFFEAQFVPFGIFNGNFLTPDGCTQ